jgi:hypothetical protein
LIKFKNTGPSSTAKGFNEEIFIDFLKIKDSVVRNSPITGCLLVIDYYSRYLYIHPVFEPISSRAVLEALENWSSEFSHPQRIRLDRGLENNNQYVKAFCAENNIGFQPGATGHPQTQGAVERVNRTLQLLVRTLKQESPTMSLAQRLYKSRGIYNHRFHKSLGMSPLEKVGTTEIPDVEVEESENEDEESDEFENLSHVSYPDVGIEQRVLPEVGSKVLWKKVRFEKDEFPYVEATVKKVYDRGGMVVTTEDGRERIVNVDRVALLPNQVDEVEQTANTDVRRYPVRSTRGQRPRRFSDDET